MGRRDRPGSVNDTGNSAAGAGWPAALTPAPQRVATFKNGAAHLTNSNFMRARATSGERHTAPRMLTTKAFCGRSCKRAHLSTRWKEPIHPSC